MQEKRIKREITGVILLDKPMGMSSNRALQKVKHALNAKKAGHTGSLDPLATGLLPICLGDATKFSHNFLSANKTYEVTARLGVRTETSDAEGEVVSTKAVPKLSECNIKKYLSAFQGEQAQQPSLYSALKYQGKPLYYYARKGIEVPRKERIITVYDINLLKFDGVDLRLSIRCSKGTYIRTIVDDLGEAIGCGAHVTQLRRTEVEGLSNEMCLLTDILAADEADRLSFVQPVDSLLLEYPAIQISQECIDLLKRGQAVFFSGLPSDTPVRLYTHDKQCVGVGKMNDDGLLASVRMFQADMSIMRAIR